MVRQNIENDSEKIPPLSEKDAKKLQDSYELVERPDKFADAFCKAAESQSKIKDAILSELQKALVNDVPSKKALKAIIHDVEKEELWIWGKRIGFAVWTVFSLVAGALLNRLIP